MQKKRILLKLIPLLFILSIVWLFFYIGKKTIEQPTDSISTYIPENTEWIMNLNTNELIQKGIESVLFSNATDKELNTLISDFILQQKDKEVRLDDLGIHFNSNICLFKITIQQESYICGLFNLENPSLFIEKSPELLSSSFQVFNHDNVGLIIYSQSNDQKKIAQSIFKNKNQGQLPTNYSFNLKTKSGDYSSDINASVLDSSILLNGSFIVTSNLIASNICLKPEGFHFTSRFVPQYISDSICSFLQIDSNAIIGISLNHSSSEFISQPEISLRLNSSILLHFKSPISIESQLYKTVWKNELINLEHSTFFIGKEKYYTHQINPSCIYVGKTAFNESLITTRNDIFYMDGPPSNLTRIKGEGIVLRFLKIIPMFQACESLTNSIENIQFRTTENKINKIDGKITFKPGEKSMNELIRFALLMNE